MHAGMVIWKSGATYTGQVKDTQLHGQGTMKYANGDVYRSGWVKGKRSGQGELRAAPGSGQPSLKGAWAEDKFMA